MPQIVGKDNSQFLKVINTQAETQFYKDLAESMMEALRRLEEYSKYEYYMDSECKRIVEPRQKDIDNAVLEMENDMFPNELTILIKALINSKGRLLTSKEIYQVSKLYNAYKTYSLQPEDTRVKIEMVTIRRRIGI